MRNVSSGVQFAKVSVMSKPVRIERHGKHILVIHLDRPEARNAINPEMAQLIGEAVETAAIDPELRVGILTSAGEVFCAGADLKTIAAGKVRELTYKDKGFAGFIHAASPIPWIAAVNGTAVGGGTEFALACDMVVASENAVFGLPEVKRGLYAGAGGIFRLPRAIPRAVAIEMICTGEPITAARAYALGLVNHLTAQGGALVCALELAEQIVAAAPIAVRKSLAVARAADDRPDEELWSQSREIAHVIHRTEDFREGLAAFGEKRSPVWRGR
jgi:enoyl-CoA hydratase/carnithine racemase